MCTIVPHQTISSADWKLIWSDELCVFYFISNQKIKNLEKLVGPCQHNRWWLILLQLLYRAYVNVSFYFSYIFLNGTSENGFSAHGEDRFLSRVKYLIARATCTHVLPTKTCSSSSFVV
jgi:hypothetical protein